MRDIKLIICVILLIIIGNHASHAGNNKLNRELICREHNVLEKECFICDSSLREKGRLWCREHSRYEDRCWICHPDARDNNRLFCGEHYLYEDECRFCNPSYKEKPGLLKKKSSKELICREHKVPERECGICQPQLASLLKTGQSLKVRFNSKFSAQRAGISTIQPVELSSSDAVNSFFQTTYNENAMTHVSPLASGIIKLVLADVGDDVKKDQVLVEVHSAEIAKAKMDFLIALTDYQVKKIAYWREERLFQKKITSEEEYLATKAMCDIALLTKKSAHQQLLNYGFTIVEIDDIEKTNDSSSMLKVRAPFSGTLVTRTAVDGQHVNSGEVLFTLVDLKKMWLELSISAEYIPLIEKGQKVRAIMDNQPGVIIDGKITWLSTSIDPHSRMFKARAVISNQSRHIKSRMFGKAEIITGKSEKLLFVPRDAVQNIDEKTFVFIKTTDDLFELRRIVMGNETDNKISILEGVRITDNVVHTGTFTVMSEFLKSRLGAGCVDD